MFDPSTKGVNITRDVTWLTQMFFPSAVIEAGKGVLPTADTVEVPDNALKEYLKKMRLSKRPLKRLTWRKTNRKRTVMRRKPQVTMKLSILLAPDEPLEFRHTSVTTVRLPTSRLV
jgi:hypothetical protein